MRFSILTCWAVLTVVAILSAQSTDDDPYYIRTVRDALTMRSGEQVVIRSWNQKHLSRLGDRVSIALLKILDQQALTDPQTVRALLPIVRDSFAEPQFIEAQEDRSPKVTLFLLGYLRRSVADVQIQEAVEETTLYVKQKVASLAAK